ncbi:MAG: GYD domain-containing protein [Candidatus Manganitrophus sp.]|uniref:GYD domain-containing protein n=1 Tax=Candidatus Manganitrophus noduliformans TaxID=2606439 RepID=A0A7X6IC66_9BACT|nr:GYD domain-containing protein [Candidatus Manganitrophus noduliformans]MCG3110714.1 GYD domain-containing protein [Candidatus Manganitrophus morganii]MDC4205486.1 GYD domain-containing protein [Candidatus Manganitrophus sp.]MCG3116075.1 GYD domain-containing protein [Candidatus Manganitrophus morganii]NKE72144.1 GYD domain-containing protein [Candidatus Manganitrophus noduliformans]WDT72678.1 MAG: GYD domain-containing protein [Candidatus Manganitrophus sp.]
MATYIMLSTLTDDGSETLKENPSRLKEVNKEIEGMGVKIMSQYATLGPYDFVNIIEAPDNETVARLSVELGGRGSVKLLTMPAIPIDRFIASLQPQKK